LQIDEETYLKKYTRLNIFAKYQGRNPNNKGDRFPEYQAELNAKKMVNRLKGERVVFFGRKPAKAFGLYHEFLKWFEGPAFTAAIVPHPSGLNRWWNDPKNKKKAKKFLRQIS